MALWNKVRSDIRIMGQLLDYYGNQERRFPLEVREIFADLIEEAVCGKDIVDDNFSTCNGLNPDEKDDGPKIVNFLKTLTNKLESQCASSQTFQFLSVVWKLRQILPVFKERTKANYLEFYRSIREMIQYEIDLLNSQAKPIPLTPLALRLLPDSLLISLDSIRQRIDLSASKLAQFKDQNCPGFHKPYLPSLLVEYEKGLSGILKDASEAQKIFIDERISLWKLQQQHLAIGISQEKKLVQVSELQSPAEALFINLTTILRQLQEAEVELKKLRSSAGNLPTLIPVLIQTASYLLEALVRESFIVVNQPPLVVKQGLHVNEIITASLLVGRTLLPLKDTSVNLAIINEAQAKQLYQLGVSVLDQLKNGLNGSNGNGGKSSRSGDLFEKGSNLSQLMVDVESNRVLVNFDKVKLIARVRDGGRRGGGLNQFVMEEKFCFLFRVSIDVLGLSFQTWTRSHPFTVSTHKSQTPLGAATVIWDYATGKVNRVPFEVSDSISWSQMSTILSSFVERASDGVGLTDAQLDCLRQKLFTGCMDSLSEVTWSELTRRKFFSSKDIPMDKGFSFWDWFYGAIRQLEDRQVKSMWQKRLFHGFIRRDEAERKLLEKPPGTFLMRYSDTILSSVSIAYVYAERCVLSMKPFMLRDLPNSSLADFIKELVELKFLYMENEDLCARILPKDELFETFYSKPLINNNNNNNKNSSNKSSNYVNLVLVPRPSGYTGIPSPSTVELLWNSWRNRTASEASKTLLNNTLEKSKISAGKPTDDSDEKKEKMDIL